MLTIHLNEPTSRALCERSRNEQRHCFFQDQIGSRERVAGRREMNCQRALVLYLHFKC